MGRHWEFIQGSGGCSRCCCCVPLGLGRCCSFLSPREGVLVPLRHIGLRLLDLGGVIPPSSSSERFARSSWDHLSLQLANWWGLLASLEVEVAAGADLVRTCFFCSCSCSGMTEFSCLP